MRADSSVAVVCAVQSAAHGTTHLSHDTSISQQLRVMSKLCKQ
jgi:hypothetical protein